MKNADWVIIDTETDGLIDPIHVVEIAGQRMRGWEPVGEKFRVLLNHGIRIPAEATAVHGYTTQFLKTYGIDPRLAHAKFRQFAGSLPLVAHNLSFDWDRVLTREWERMGLQTAGQRGFCTLMLSRRLVAESKRHTLDSLRYTFRLSTENRHRAFADVDAVVELFVRIFKPRLEAAGVETWEELAKFAKRTPVSKCLAQCARPATTAA